MMVCLSVTFLMVSIVLPNKKVGDSIYNTTTATALVAVSISFYHSVRQMHTQILTLPREQRSDLFRKLTRFRCAVMSAAMLFNLRLVAWFIFQKTGTEKDYSSPYWDCYFALHGPLELFFLEWLGLLVPSFILLFISSNVDGQAVMRTYADANDLEYDDEEGHHTRFLSYRDSTGDALRESEYDKGRGRGSSYAPRPWGIRNSGADLGRDSFVQTKLLYKKSPYSGPPRRPMPKSPRSDSPDAYRESEEPADVATRNTLSHSDSGL
jgi:hypothetical protein